MQVLTRPVWVVALSILSLPLSQVTQAASNPQAPKAPAKPCTVQSTTTGSYFDLNPIALAPPELKDGRKVHKTDRDTSWQAQGHDYGTNFTVNICAPVIETVKDVVGVDKSRWQNVSAYYQQDGKIYSIGEQASEPIFRGRRLVLNYTNGSPCPSSKATFFESRSIDDDESTAYGHNYYNKGISSTKDTESVRKKSTILSFLCDRDAHNAQATVSFVGTMDSCTYFFEVRSSAACGGVAAAPQGGLGPAGVFGVIALIAVIVYLVGGCAYQRTVMHQRGWRQCPNFSMWSDVLGFISDFFIILFSSLTRCFTKKDGSASYSHLNGSGAQRRGLIGAIGGRGGSNRANRGDVDAENRLIDQLDEEWND
ncbi:putative vacuolar sorting receptor [Talaromyces proteolyticus]|uniref:Vacuolar sorting receptor n=1 Tax=Talaromyces proteolyticus TaxID=1131652 RepID=A0AAD4KI76_9EURO|nr:putative vacuolar sorting receptor [Talaromyces proteolyticus]KAH8692828.1 putative vacuolar sorting receptor [Talaromyces proteolyticus]